MKNPEINRRKFIQQTSKVSLGFLGLQVFLSTFLQSCSDAHTPISPVLKDKYGELKEDPKGIINLPEGFTYKIIARKGEIMSDGMVHPDKPDGMAAFAANNGKMILIRNHELMPTNFSAFGKEYEHLEKMDRSKLYDFRNGNSPCSGGTTTLVIDEETLTVEKSWLSLGGTLRNCAGGATPWNSWITCEEIVLPPSNGYEKGHGYNFEVPATEDIAIAKPIPLKAMGQFNHEAVCVDPRTSIVYQTEDREDGLIYRFIPNVPQELWKGGRLQALAIKGRKRAVTRNWRDDKEEFPIGRAMKVEWLDIEDVEEVPNDDLRIRGFEMGAAKFARGEGMWFGEQELYFACTSGGARKAGQIFRYTPSIAEGTAGEKDKPGRLELFLEPNDITLLKHCDNLTIAPWGDVVFCEDEERPRVMSISKEGHFSIIAESIHYKSEFAGGVFSPSGKTFFVNIQHAGLTVAIQGPWQKEIVIEEPVIGA